MLYRIIVPMVSLRKEASSTSEQLSQLLFGDYLSILDWQNNWIKIQNERDSCVGFMDSSPESFLLVDDTSILSLDKIQICTKKESYVKAGKLRFNVTFGSTKINHQDFAYVDSDWEQAAFNSETALQLLTRELLGSPYLWGGKSHFGIDCSGFTQIYGFLLGKFWPRDSHQQAEMLPLLLDVENAKRGDLLFFKNDLGKIVHVGINLGQHEILHASVTVKIEKFTRNGIINTFTQQLSHKMAGYLSVE